MEEACNNTVSWQEETGEKKRRREEDKDDMKEGKSDTV